MGQVVKRVDPKLAVAMGVAVAATNACVFGLEISSGIWRAAFQSLPGALALLVANGLCVGVAVGLATYFYQRRVA